MSQSSYRSSERLSSSSCPPLAFTAWQKVNNPLGTRGFFSWLDFCERLKSPQSCTNKKDLSGWAPAFFRGDHREKERCEGVSALVWDYEKGATTPQEAEAFFRPLCMGAFHTSYSHQPSTPRFRVVLPLSRLVNPEEHGRLWVWMYEKITKAGHTVDAACKDPSRLWFAPGHHPEAANLYEARIWEGEPLNADAILAKLPQEAPRTPGKPPPLACPTPRAPQAGNGALSAEERARLYLSKMEAAVAGARGHDTTYRAACALVIGFNLDTSTALSLLLSEFNPRCSPPWSERELRHKVESANKETGPRGLKLEEGPKERPRSLLGSSSLVASIRPAPPTIGAELLDPTRNQAALHIQNAIRLSLSTLNRIGVVVLPPSGGKSQGALQVIKAWSELQGLPSPFPFPLALLTPSHKLAVQTAGKAELLGVSAARFFSPPGGGGVREATPQGSHKGLGPLVCIKPRPTVEGHAAAGLPGHKLCVGCPMSKKEGGACESEVGRIGAEEAVLNIGVHHSPALPMEKAKALIVEEWPEIIQTHILKLEGLRALAKGCPSLLTKTRRTLQAAAESVLSWLARGAEREEDPLAIHRGALKELAQQDDGKTRPELARDPDYRPNRPEEDRGALKYKTTWKTGTALISAALEEQRLYPYGDGSAAWNGLSATGKALAEVESAVILTATPGDIAELEKATGKKALVIKIPIRPIAAIEYVLKNSASSTRSAYLDVHHLPRWQRWKVIPATPKKAEHKAPCKAHLVQDLEDLTAWLSERPQIRSLLIGTYRPVALALRILWAIYRGAQASQEDLDGWKELHGSRAFSALTVASQGRAALDSLFSLLEEREIALDVLWYHAGAGLNDWREAGQEFTACVSLGDAFPPVDSHRRRYAEARGLDLETIGDKDPEWQEAYNATAAGEEAQLHGRLGDVGRAANRPAYHFHIGRTIPAGWQESNITEYKRPKHRPARPAPKNESWLEELTAAVAKAGSVAALARLWFGEKKWESRARTLRRYLAGASPDDTTHTLIASWQEEQIGLARRGEAKRTISTTEIEREILGGVVLNVRSEIEVPIPPAPPLASPLPLAAIGRNWPDPEGPRAFYTLCPPELLGEDLEPDYEAEERAAILEFEGGLSRSEAERAVGIDWTRFDEEIRL